MTVERTLKLPPHMSAAQFAELAAELQASMGQPLALDMSGAGNLGTQAVQLLLSIARDWKEQGCGFRVIDAEGHLGSALTRLGIRDAGIAGVEVNA